MECGTQCASTSRASSHQILLRKPGSSHQHPDLAHEAAGPESAARPPGKGRRSRDAHLRRFLAAFALLAQCLHPLESHTPSLEPSAADKKRSLLCTHWQRCHPIPSGAPGAKNNGVLSVSCRNEDVCTLFRNTCHF